MQVRFDAVTAGDLEMLQEWIGRPHWQDWWLAPEHEIAFIRDMIEGRDTTRPFIFNIDGEPTGYIQYWFVGHHQNASWIADHPWLAELPDDAVGVDLSIADASKLSKGIGSRVLAEFSRRRVAESRRTVIIDPDPCNARAIRAYEKAGYRVMPDLLGKSTDCLIMRYEPQTNEQV